MKKAQPSKPHESKVEDTLALKRLVDTFSKLADVKDVKSQMDLFTDDAEVVSKTGEQTFRSKGKKEIEKAFSDYLALFDIVYHLNGQKLLILMVIKQVEFHIVLLLLLVMEKKIKVE